MKNTHHEQNSISRREFLTGISEQATLALALDASLEQIQGQEIKGGEEWHEGFRQLRKAVLTLPNETSAFAYLKKDGTKAWVDSKGGESVAVSRKMSDVESIIERLNNQGARAIYEFHTHPLSLSKLYDVSEGALKKMREDKHAVLPSFPPSICEINMQDDVSSQINKRVYLSKIIKSPILFSAADPRGVWVYNADPTSQFIRKNFEIQKRFRLAIINGISNAQAGKDIEAFFRATQGTDEMKIDQLLKAKTPLLRANGLLKDFTEPLIEWFDLIKQYHDAWAMAKAQDAKFEDDSFVNKSLDTAPLIKSYADLGVHLSFTPWEKMNLDTK